MNKKATPPASPAEFNRPQKMKSGFNQVVKAVQELAGMNNK